MELKKYQEQVLDDITAFNEVLEREGNIYKAFNRYWDERGVSLRDGSDYLHPYVNTVPGVPRVTVKVPTAGGKTFIACNALKRIFDSFAPDITKAVAWFVPSDTILKQTYRRLSDPTDPYRQRIDTLFNGRVKVYDKEALLNGSGFNPVAVKEQLSIFVLSIQSFASNSNEGRRARRENENLTEFVNTYTPDTHRIEDIDETALLQVLASLNPVVIIDEAHNFTADLRVETLQDLSPRYILELTATPRHNSNIISFVDAYQLKRENMVKLPVIVYNHDKINDVVSGAINLQRSLEQKAKTAEERGGDYIRPIVLFQAQPRTGEENTTFDKVKAKLIEVGIPEAHIKIKTADRDELKNIDLMSPDCDVRYIITVDALKEGWDCPFAYILASLANKTSRISVEQILGRILRQPYTRRQPVEFLNLSYVFTCSSDFQATIQEIIKSLNKSGFSGRDYRVAQPSATSYPKLEEEKKETLTTDLFSSVAERVEDENPSTTIVEEDEIDNIDLDAVKNDIIETPETTDSETENVLLQASKEAEKYNEAINAQQQTTTTPTDVMDQVDTRPMKDLFRDEGMALRLPQFFIKVEQESNVFFDNAIEEMPLSSDHLMEGFDLSVCDRHITFEQTHAEAVAVDLEEQRADEYVPKFRSLNERQLKVFGEYFRGLDDSGKVNRLTSQLERMLQGKFDAIPVTSLREYIKAVLRDQPPHKLQDLANNVLNTKTAFENKIEALAKEHKKQRFDNLLDVGKIVCRESFALPDVITPRNSPIGLSKSLYIEENKIDDFEWRVISQIANLDNVKFWHRNFERGHGFKINGFINHYPDFIVRLNNGKTLAIEVKGDHLDGSDSAYKIKVGKTWASKAGDDFRYFMVFETRQVDGAHTLPDLLNLIRQIQ